MPSLEASSVSSSSDKLTTHWHSVTTGRRLRTHSAGGPRVWDPCICLSLFRVLCHVSLSHSKTCWLL